MTTRAYDIEINPWGDRYKIYHDWPKWRGTLEAELHNQQSFCFGQISYAINYTVKNESNQLLEVDGRKVLDYIIDEMDSYPNGLNAAVVQAVEHLYNVNNLILNEIIIDWLEDK